jgi:hypothetical protein
MSKRSSEYPNGNLKPVENYPGVYRYLGPTPTDNSDRVESAKKDAMAARVRESAKERVNSEK